MGAVAKGRFFYRRPADRRVWHIYAAKGGPQAQSLCGFRSVLLVDESLVPPASQRDMCRTCDGQLVRLLAED